MQNHNEFFHFKNDKGGHEGVRLSEIKCARSDGNYTHIYTANRKITLHQLLSDVAIRFHWDKMLMRIHRQYILRYECILHIMSTDEDAYVTLVEDVHEQLISLDEHFRESKTLPIGKEGKILLLSAA
jgi:DNA-binding LytR/AlgR family response regulator